MDAEGEGVDPRVGEVGVGGVVVAGCDGVGVPR